MRRSLLLASVAGLSALPLSAEAQTAFNWAGFYAGLHAGYLRGDVVVDEFGMPSATGTIEGGIFGGLAGFNAAASTGLVWSLEGDVGFGDLHGTGDSTTDVFTYDFDWNMHFRARAGVPVGNAGGLALAQLHVSETTTLGGLYTGGTIGGGVDFMLTPKIVGRFEGLRDIFQRQDYGDYSVDFSSWTARAALIFRLP
jgi:outer membrane immunogenic protein